MNQQEFNRKLCDFLGVATTPFHAVAEIARQLTAAGFTPLAEDHFFPIPRMSSCLPLNANDDVRPVTLS